MAPAPQETGRRDRETRRQQGGTEREQQVLGAMVRALPSAPGRYPRGLWTRPPAAMAGLRSGR